MQRELWFVSLAAARVTLSALPAAVPLQRRVLARLSQLSPGHEPTPGRGANPSSRAGRRQPVSFYGQMSMMSFLPRLRRIADAIWHLGDPPRRHYPIVSWESFDENVREAAEDWRGINLDIYPGTFPKFVERDDPFHHRRRD